MKKIIFLLAVGSFGFSAGAEVKQLSQIIPTSEYCHEIATQANSNLAPLWNALTPEERVFAYYMMRASVPGNRIIADQTHRDALELIELFQTIIMNKEVLSAECAKDFEVDLFLADAETFFLYLTAHHGQYFLKEFENHKRTPETLGLQLLTPDNMIRALDAIGIPNARVCIDRLHSSLFDAEYEPTVVVDGSIEKSAGNIYSPDFTQADFDALDSEIKSVLNAYFFIDELNGVRIPSVERYKIGAKYGEELEVAHHWITKAQKHAQQYPDIFDRHVSASLGYMLRYLETGDEDHFKKFSIEWLKTTSRIDFNFGFVETYQDPLQFRGTFEADVTIKAMDMKKLNALLPSLEKQLPFPEEFKRQNLDDLGAIPNASVNAKLFASGDAGPAKNIAAYCLPNYHEIRAVHGSKQIMYQNGKNLGQQVNPELARNLFYSREHAAWLGENDPNGDIKEDIWDVHTVLHETLGHGSGRPTAHTFVEGDPLLIAGKSYNIGDTILVTSDVKTEIFGGYSGAFEELRAEILALYISIYNYDDLAASGLYKDWPTKIGKDTLIEWLIIEFMQVSLHRLLAQVDDATEIVQAHARADTAILNYLLDHGGIELVEERYDVNGTAHLVVDTRIVDLQKTLDAIKQMAIEVQRCTSTADGQGIERIMKKYGLCVRHPEYIVSLKANRSAVQGELVEAVEIFPRLIPVVDSYGAIVDISAEWPENFIEQQLEFNKLALSKD